MEKLIPQAHIDKKISLKDFGIIKDILQKNDLSRYKLKRKDIYVVKNNQDDIIACGRVFHIGNGALELGSLRVDPVHRGKKIGLLLCKELLQDKADLENIYLATKRALEGYYKKIGFEAITQDIPEKLLYTKKRAEGEGIDCIIMKLQK